MGISRSSLRSEAVFLLQASRPGLWLTAIAFYMLPLGQRAVFHSLAFWLGARFTALSLSAQALRLPPWWLGGPVFLGLELLVHALPQLRAQPNFYNGLR